jgi:hypothetical protein
MDTSSPARPKHRLTWFVVLFGLLEIAAIVAFVEVKSFASTVCSATVAVQGLGTAPAPIAGGGGGGGMQSGGDAAAQPPPVASSAVPQPVDSAASVPAPATQGSDASVQGDTNQIVDPKCVGKSAAALLSSDSPPPGPTCGPMTQPPELQKAEQQISK